MSDHPLLRILDDAAAMGFPAEDGRVEVLPPLSDDVSAVIAFSWHHFLAADVDSAWVAGFCPRYDLAAPISARFLGELAARTGGAPGLLDNVLVARGTGSGPQLALREIPPPEANLRVARSLKLRDDTRTLVTEDGAGLLILGRGVAGRRELAFEVVPSARRQGLGRSLIQAALAMTPANESLWAQVAPGNVASLRALLASGFRPICAEILIVR